MEALVVKSKIKDYVAKKKLRLGGDAVAALILFIKPFI